MRLGVDVSTYLEEKLEGAKYFDNGVEFDPLARFKSQGVDLIRLRVWNNPYLGDKPYLGGTNSLENDLKIMSDLKKYDFSYIIDFHYSDFWVDPGKQTLPKEWKDLSFEQLLIEVYKFTKESLEIIKKEGYKVPYIQIGNEITNGMLWPIGQLIEKEKGQVRDNYYQFSELLKAGIKAAKEVYKDAKIIIHLERSNDENVYQELFSKLEEYDVNYDVIGMSYYPYWHGTFSQLFSNIEKCRNRFHKNVMICELGYGFTLEDYLLTENGQSELKITKENLEADLPFDVSVKGQEAFIEEFLSRSLKADLEGVIYWEPLWIPGENICWASKEGQAYIHEEGKPTRNEWSNQCLVDYKGYKLPAFDKYKISK